MTVSAPRVLLIGFGAIGRQLVTLFDQGEFDVKAFVRDVNPHIKRGTLGVELYDKQLPKLIADSDIVVEVAGVSAAKELGPAVIFQGKGLVLTSVGALADPSARQTLLAGDLGSYRWFRSFCGGCGGRCDRHCKNPYQQER